MREQGGMVPADDVEARLIELREKKLTMNSNASARARLTPERAKAKVGRNDPCLCGSGKKSKRCCDGPD